MKPSTAKFIPYDLRPAKQAERRILLDFLKCANEAGITTSDCRYVGMGGTKFYDFHLMHRFLGTSNMVSLERDPKTHPRCEFNQPFDFVSVRKQTAADFLRLDKENIKTIYWLDYDDGISTDITADIATLGIKVKCGGFAFVTVCTDPPGVLRKDNSGKRLSLFQQDFGELSVGLDVQDMENSNFPKTVRKILLRAFQNAFAARDDGKFEVLFQVEYKDSSQMLTMGGCLCPQNSNGQLIQRLKRDLPFLIKETQPYRIRSFNLTERERVLFDIAVTKRRSNSAQANHLKKLGFKSGELKAYKDLIRFLPRYYESII